MIIDFDKTRSDRGPGKLVVKTDGKRRTHNYYGPWLNKDKNGEWQIIGQAKG